MEGKTEMANIPRKGSIWQAFLSGKYFKWTLLLPLIVVLTLFMLYPLFYNLYMSFHYFTIVKGPGFIGFDNYRQLFQDPTFWATIGRTFQLLVICIAIELLLGMAAAVLFNRKFKGQNVIQGLCLLPLLISPLAMSLMWQYLLHIDFGIVNQGLRWIGVGSIPWLSNSNIALYSIAAITIWQWTPFSIFVFLAGLNGIPQDILEATRVDGANYWFAFRKLVLPMLKPLIIIVVLLRTMWLIRTYSALYGTTRGGLGTETVDWYVSRIAFNRFDVGYGATLAIFSLYITIIIANLLFRQLMKAIEK